MKKKWTGLFSLCMLMTSCSQSEATVETEKEDNSDNIDQSAIGVESMAKRHIEANLQIPSNEKYTYKIFKAHLDGDDKMDAVIAVNRLEFALNKASADGKTAKRAELGYMGNYNYLFYYDGGLNQISPNIPIPSSPKAPLNILFEHVTSTAFKDIIVEYRILNASYRDYFTVTNHTPRRVFSWKNFEGINDSEKEAFCFSYTDGTMGPSRDILVKKASFQQAQEESNVYTYIPKLIESDEVLHRFFYHPKMEKYVTKK
jgi:hypothetical protein